ncbi:MAG TPA: hypothetical protein VGP16_07380 [Asanoa sp.]|jgi:hypothetical protein|nr:hypothetical protein [Asanoa sp.]
MFEHVVDLIRGHAPQAAIAFNTSGGSTARHGWRDGVHRPELLGVGLVGLVRWVA